jgi:hypothetical protein
LLGFPKPSLIEMVVPLPALPNSVLTFVLFKLMAAVADSPSSVFT